MTTKELIDFIKAEQVKGVSKDDIYLMLIKNGWNDSDVQEGFNIILGPTDSSSISTTETSKNKKVLPLVLAAFLLGIGAFGFYFKDDLSNLFNTKNELISGQENALVPQNNTEEENIEPRNEEATLIQQNQQFKTTEESTVSATQSSTNYSLKPYHISFISPNDNIKVLSDGSVAIRIQVGEKIKKVSLMFITDDINIKDVEIPVQSGYANYILNLPGTTLAPIAVLASGITDDNTAYLEAENKLTEKEFSDTHSRVIKPYTDKKPNVFILENDNRQVNEILVGQTESPPQFLVGFSGGPGLVSISGNDIEFKVNNPGFLQVIKGTDGGPTLFKGLKEGSSSVTATYKGLSKDIYYTIE